MADVAAKAKLVESKGDGDASLSASPVAASILDAATGQSFTNLRRRKLTQVDVLSAAPPLRTLNTRHVLCAAAVVVAYTGWVLPWLRHFGDRRWAQAVALGVLQPRPGGPFADVSFAYALLLSLTYVGACFVGVSRMAQRASPVRLFIFECMAVHNITQCLFNLYCFAMLLAEGHRLGLGLWGNPHDASERGHVLGGLVWLQYHCRQLQLLETFFMVLRKKFQGVSFLHGYLRVLNLWGWYIACRCFGGGEAYFPALVSSACQASVYGLYFSFSLIAPEGQEAPGPGVPAGVANASGAPQRQSSEASVGDGKRSAPTRAARVFELQIAQYVICALHAIAAAVWGNFPTMWALLHLCVIGQGLLLYTDFHSTRPLAEQLHSADFGELEDEGANPAASADGRRRVTFSFDSCGWLMVYHFGVGAYISEHCGLELGPSAPLGEYTERFKGVAFSGSSGGSLVSAVLGAGSNVRDVFEYIVEQYPDCRRNPLAMFPAVEKALRKFQYEGAQKRLTRSVRVLLTRVSLSPPFVMGEIADHFPDLETSVQILCASCHVPLVAGLLPKKIGRRFYYDGLLWPSRLFVPWRGAEGDFVVRVSACSAPLADLRTPRWIPQWWMLLPPPPDILRGLFWLGYCDAARWFATEPPVERAAFDPCRCRRPAQGAAAPSDDGERFSAHVRWKAAHALLTEAPRGDVALPETDPRTGQDVKALIAQAEALAKRQGAMVAYAAGALLVGVLAAAAVAVPALV